MNKTLLYLDKSRVYLGLYIVSALTGPLHHYADRLSCINVRIIIIVVVMLIYIC